MQAVLFLQRVAVFSLSRNHYLPQMKPQLHLQWFLLLLEVPISHKTIGTSYHPLSLGGQSALSSRLPLTSPCPPLPSALTWAPPGLSTVLVAWSLFTRRLSPTYKLGNLFSLSAWTDFCSVGSWKKPTGEALCSVDLNHDVGVFLPVGHSAQGFTAPVGTGRNVHKIWTVPELLRSSKCGAEEQSGSFCPSPFSFTPLFLWGVSSFPTVTLCPSQQPGTSLRTTSACACLIPFPPSAPSFLPCGLF